jgi:hypothetical protein
MRVEETGPVLKVRAIAGVHVVVLAWDFVHVPAVKRGQPLPDTVSDLLGFAISRQTLDAQGVATERAVLKGIKRFRDKDAGLPPGTPVRTDEHPVQSFLWADYTVGPETSYVYTVTPVHGAAPKLLDLGSANATSVAVVTEPELDGRQGVAHHDVYFNRGVIGSQAYAREFKNVDPSGFDPTSPEMAWLSHGLFEGFLSFVARASDERYALRGAFYEFWYQPAVNALGAAHERGVDVKVVYEAEGGVGSYLEENKAALATAGLLQPEIAYPRTKTTGIRHNKFLILLHDDEPVAVWTGSTNISEGGIFGHANVGHAVDDPALAASYLEYWKKLASDPTVGQLKATALATSPLPAGAPPLGTTVLFSPRDDADSTATLEWYADRIREASRVVCISFAFNYDEVFQAALNPSSEVLRYIVKDDALGKNELIGRDGDLLFAAGGRLDEGALKNFLAERGNPLNVNDYIHTKILLVDPLSDDPLVVTGSANFSRPSQRQNDENMLVIRGDTRVADIYLGEFMRVFDHHYARYLVQKLSSIDPETAESGYLKTTAEEWLPGHFIGAKRKRRTYFAETP